MDDVVSTFPLLHLPIDTVLNTLRSMSHLEIYGISTLSKKTKNIVESLKLTATQISVTVTDAFEARLEFPNNLLLSFGLYQVLENEPLRELETPADVYVLYGENPWVPWANLMSVKQLIDHLQCIFHTSMNILLFGANCERFSLESIQKTVKDFQSICFISENHKQNRRVLSIFQPAELILLDAALDDGHIPRFLSVQNFDVIRASGLQITLDDLLVNNARSFDLASDRLSINIPNQFLKLWKKGSNLRLEFLHLRFRSADFQVEELLRGLKHQDAPPNRRRIIKVSGMKNPQAIEGGWDIWRFDGTQATISVNIIGDHVRFGFFVWHDHCVVN